MATRTLALCGIDRQAEAAMHETFAQAASECGVPWQLAKESEADALLIDIDSMYGQMSWLKAQGGPRPIIALTASSRADADFLLPRDFDVHALAGMLTMLAERVAGRADAPSAGPVIAPSKPAAPVPSPAAAPVAVSVPEPAPEPQPEPEPEPRPEPPRQLRLVDYLRGSRLPGPVRLQASDPPLVVDTSAGTYLGGTALKPFLAVAAEVIEADRWEAISPHEYERLLGATGGTGQPISRLVWIAGMGAGQGELLPELAVAERFKLNKYPQAEREFPRHIRIATAMLKAPSTVDEITAASGMERADVVNYINACHAIGLVDAELPPAAHAEHAEAAKGGLFDRLRGKKA